MGMEVVQNVTNRLKRNLPGVPAPSVVTDRIERGRERMFRDAPLIEMCWRFFRNDSYCWVDAKNVLRVTPTQTSVGGGGKEPHRVRQTLPIVRPIVRYEVSAAIQRVPGYSISPTSMDPEDVSGASLSKKVAYFIYDWADIEDVTEDVVTYAAVAKMGFVFPYWDADKKKLCNPTFGLNECYWEPGLRFENSPWHCLEQGMTVDAAMEIDGYLGGELVPDATASAYTDRKMQDQGRTLVTVTEYLERPSQKYPEGRWLTIANNRVISGVAKVGGETVTRPYPCADDICIIPLSYVEDPDSDRDAGLVEDILELVRTANDAWSKQLEWKNRAMNPQILAPVGSMKGRRTDAPGAINFYVPVGGQIPQWEKVPPIPPELDQIVQRAKQYAAEVAAQNQIPNQVEAGKAIEAFYEHNNEIRGAFYKHLAKFHSRLARRNLELFQKYAPDDLIVSVRGHAGWEPIEDFKKANIRNQIDVRVDPGSLIPMTREAIQQKITTIVQLFPGYLSPEAAIMAMENGTGEEVIQEYENHVARANRIIQRVKTGTLMDMPSTIDPQTMQEVPGWMPRPFDRTEIHKHVFEVFMTTEEWESLPIEQQHAALLYYDALLQIEAEKAAQQAMAQTAMAENLGMKNAAQPQAKPMPSMPGGQPQNGGSVAGQ